MQTRSHPETMTDDELADWLASDEGADRLLQENAVVRSPEIEALMRARDAEADAQQGLTTAVLEARRAGISWTGIGQVLQVSRQAARQRYAPLVAELERDDAP